MTTSVLLLAISLLQAEPAAAPPAKEVAATAQQPGATAEAPATAPDAAKGAVTPEAAKTDSAPTTPPEPAAAAASPAPETPPMPAGEPPAASQSVAPSAAAEPIGGSAPALPEAAALAAPAAAFSAAEAAPVGGCGSGEECDCAKEKDGLSHVGFSFGLGFPEFAMASVIVRPLDWLRVGAGASYNYAGYGLRAEATLAPIRWYISPTLNVAYGRYMKLDPSKAASVPTELEGLAAKVNYQYVSASLGLELGNQRHGMLILQVGASRIAVDAPGTAVFDGTATGGGGSTTTTLELTGVSVSGFVPSGSLSWIIFL